jgi:hypothetical protein
MSALIRTRSQAEIRVSIGAPLPDMMIDSIAIQVSCETYVDDMFQDWIKHTVLPRMSVGGAMAIQVVGSYPAAGW